MKAPFLTILAAAGILSAVCWTYRDRLPWPAVAPEVAEARPDAERYAVLKEEAERWRKDLRRKYEAARTPADREAVLAETRTFLETLLPEMMRCWLGTPWDFNGTSERPGEGKIACGYFVSTVLRDAGFRVDRYKLARQPSQNIIRTFLPDARLSLKVGTAYEAWADELVAMEPGIRIVGLDSHVAFIVKGADDFRFIHSSGASPWQVVDESRSGADVLRRSRYRVHGLLTADTAVLKRWLRNEKFAVKGASTAN